MLFHGGELLGKQVDFGGDVDVQVQHSDDVDKQKMILYTNFQFIEVFLVFQMLHFLGNFSVPQDVQ